MPQVSDVNTRDGHGHTPLMLAIGQGNMACTEILLATKKVNVGLVSANGLTVADFVEVLLAQMGERGKSRVSTSSYTA